MVLFLLFEVSIFAYGVCHAIAIYVARNEFVQHVPTETFVYSHVVLTRFGVIVRFRVLKFRRINHSRDVRFHGIMIEYLTEIHFTVFYLRGKL